MTQDKCLKDLEPLYVLVGFLGSGKTTALRKLTKLSLEAEHKPWIVLNDYQDATLDLGWFKEHLSDDHLSYLNGSCICCDGLGQLRQALTHRPRRTRPLTLIEANGTSDAIELMAHLAIGVGEGLAYPVQISTVHCERWQLDANHATIERDQVKGANHILITHVDVASKQRQKQVQAELEALCPHAQIHLDVHQLWQALQLQASKKGAKADSPACAENAEHPDHSAHVHSAETEHRHYHFASTQIPLPEQVSAFTLADFLERLPASLLRVKGLLRIEEEQGNLMYFEKFANGETNLRPFKVPAAYGPRLIAIGPGADEEVLLTLAQQVFGDFDQSRTRSSPGIGERKIIESKDTRSAEAHAAEAPS